jgi:hypothetical protein
MTMALAWKSTPKPQPSGALAAPRDPVRWLWRKLVPRLRFEPSVDTRAVLTRDR